jgi:hypothetical protein
VVDNINQPVAVKLNFRFGDSKLKYENWIYIDFSFSLIMILKKQKFIRFSYLDLSFWNKIQKTSSFPFFSISGQK